MNFRLFGNRMLKGKKIFETELLNIIKNFFFNGGAKVFSKGISLLISMIIARTIGVAGSGQYAIAITYAGILYVVLNFGIYSIVQREIAKRPEEASLYISNSLGLFVYISIPATIVLGIILKFVLKLETSYTLMISACLYCGLSGIFTIISNALEGLNHFDIECKATVLYNSASLIAAFPALIFGKKIEFLIFVYVIVFLLTDIYLLCYINKKICRVSIKFSKETIGNILKMSMPLVLSSASEYINLKADTLVLGYEKGDNDTGIYSTAVNIYQGISCIPQALASAFMPSFVRTYQKNEQEGKKLFIKTFTLFFIFLGTISFAIVVFSRWLVMILYGNDYIDAVAPLVVLGFALIPMEINRFLNNTLIAMGLQKVVGFSIFIGTLFNVVSNIIFIARYSYIAAAYTTLATECLVALIDLFFVIKQFRRKKV